MDSKFDQEPIVAPPTSTHQPIQSEPEYEVNSHNEIEETKRVSKKLVLLVSFILALLIPASIYVYSKNKNTNVYNTTLAPTPVSKPTPTPDPTADWKTYTNSQYGYSIKYPSQWTVTESTSNVELSPLPICQTQNNCKTSDGIFINKTTNQDYLSAQQLLKDNGGTMTDLKIDGFDAKRTSDLPGQTENDQIFILKGSDVYNVTLIKVGQDAKIDTSTFNQILSTFKFTDTAIDTSTWKTYSDSDKNFSIQYPDDWNMYFGQEANPMYATVTKDKKDILLNGFKGSVNIHWVENYGGGCDPENHIQVTVGNQIYDACDTKNSPSKGFETLSNIQIELDKKTHLGLDIEATIKNNYSDSRSIILQILSTFKQL